MSSRPVVISGILLGFEAFLAERGVESRAVLARAGLLPSDLANPRNELPIRAVADLLEGAAHATGEPCLCLDWAEAFPVGGTGALFFLFLNSKTVGEGLSTVAHHAMLLRQAVSVQFETDRDGAALWWRWPKDFEEPYTQYGAFALALIATRIRLVTNRNWAPILVEMQGDPLACPERARTFFGENIRYRADRNLIKIDAATAGQSIAQADPGVRDFLQRVSRQIIEAPPTGDVYTAEVRKVIAMLLADRRATLEEVSAVVACSPRTLQNRLSQAGTSFEILLNGVRQARAIHLLCDTDQSMSSIASELGFSELSAFTRASHRWFGMSPSAYRKKNAV